jgi:pSer/pThr/pTyr-binding forkhead associated (FHA) protein
MTLEKKYPEHAPDSVEIEVSIVRADGKVETIALEPKRGQDFLIGRDKHCHVIADDKSVSMRHAMFYFTENRLWKLKDLGSTNGTFLNGSRVNMSGAEIFSGDKISVGLQELYVQKRTSKPKDKSNKERFDE